MVVHHCGREPVADDFGDEVSDLDEPSPKDRRVGPKRSAGPRDQMEADSEDKVSDSDEPSPKRRRAAPKRAAGPRDQMEALTNLKSIGVPEPYRRHIEKHGTDPAQFLNDKGSLVHQIAEPNHDEADLHLAVMRYTLHVQSRSTKDRSRWLLHQLLYFDLAKLKHPQGTGRIGPRMKDEIRELVKERIDDPEANPLPWDELTTWSTRGKKLNVFCQEFGIGSLFILEEYLSDNL